MMRQTFYQLLDELDDSGAEKARNTRIFMAALLQWLKSSEDQADTMRFLCERHQQGLS